MYKIIVFSDEQPRRILARSHNRNDESIKQQQLMMQELFVHLCHAPRTQAHHSLDTSARQSNKPQPICCAPVLLPLLEEPPAVPDMGFSPLSRSGPITVSEGCAEALVS